MKKLMALLCLFFAAQASSHPISTEAIASIIEGRLGKQDIGNCKNVEIKKAGDNYLVCKDDNCLVLFNKKTEDFLVHSFMSNVEVTSNVPQINTEAYFNMETRLFENDGITSLQVKNVSTTEDLAFSNTKELNCK